MYLLNAKHSDAFVDSIYIPVCPKALDMSLEAITRGGVRGRTKYLKNWANQYNEVIKKIVQETSAVSDIFSICSQMRRSK